VTSIIRKHSEITRPEWIAYRWIEVTACGDPEPLYFRTILRSIGEHEQAAKDFDLSAQAYRKAIALEATESENK